MAHFSREEKFLLACLTASLQAGSLPKPPHDLDWDELLKTLYQHRLAGWFGARVRDGSVICPPLISDRLRRERVQSLLYGQSYASELAKALSLMKARGIPVVVLKGWALIQTLYGGDTSQRVYSDADLLIPSRFVDAGEQVLLELGYQPAPDEPHPGYFKRYGANLAFLNPNELKPFKGHVHIELHWALFHVPYFSQRIDMDGLFARAVPVSILNETALELSPPDMLIHLAAHQILHHSNEEQLARDYELAAWIDKFRNEIDWAMLARRAKEWRLELAVRQALERIEALWPGFLPAAALAEFLSLPTGWIGRLVFRMETKRLDLLRVLVIFLSLPAAYRLRYLLEKVFPGPKFMRWRYGAPPLGFWPLLYFMRLGNALSRLPRLFGLGKR